MVATYRSKLIIEIEIQAVNETQATRRWDNVLEKIKYQTANVKMTSELEPFWIEVESESNADS